VFEWVSFPNHSVKVKSFKFLVLNHLEKWKNNHEFSRLMEADKEKEFLEKYIGK
jgi:hypothetical protein